MVPNRGRKEKMKVFEKQYIAHRGLFDNESEAPENSIPAFQRAVQQGYGIELDVQLTTDNRLVVFHDETLQRMCGFDKKLTECSYDELKHYRLAKSDEKIPLFDEVLKVIDGKVPLIVEVKSEGDWKKTTQLMAERMGSYQGCYCMESFHPFAVKWFKDHRPDFIAYNHLWKKDFSYTLCRKLFKPENVASLITDTEGSSAVLKGAFVTYCNEAKIMQGVPAEIIDKYTVYSTQTAEAMAKACTAVYQADIGIGVTGTMGNVDPANPETINWNPQIYNYAERTGNLKAEAVGVVSGEKHFPVFEGGMVFKPLTKSKPLSTPLFAYAEVFWSWVIDAYFIPAPQYQLALCRGYEAECGKYYDYGTVSPMIYEEGEYLLNLLEFFRAYPDDKVQIDDYLNYCQMFYDYTEILEADYFQKNRENAEDLVMQILISVLKGDQNYHYENIAFVCDASGQILRLAPMIDHEFSTYFMFPDNIQRHTYWLDELKRSIEGKPVRPEEYKDFSNEKERRLMEKSATCLHNNLVYIKEHYPEVTATFLENVSRLKRDLLQKRESFFIQKAKDYPDYANSDAYLIGKARYKDHDEEKAAAYEKQYGREGKEISFDLMNCLINYEVQEIIEQMERILR